MDYVLLSSSFLQDWGNDIYKLAVPAARSLEKTMKSISSGVEVKEVLQRIISQAFIRCAKGQERRLKI